MIPESNRHKYRKSRSENALRRVSKIRLLVRGKPYEFDLATEVGVLPYTSDILDRHAERFIFWRRMLANMRKNRRSIESEMEETKAALYLRLRDVFSEKGENTSERRLDAEVRIQPAYMILKKKYEAALAEEDLIDGVVSAMNHRQTVLMKRSKEMA